MRRNSIGAAESGMSWQRRQLRQTIIGTGVVGAVVGGLPLLAAFLLAFGRTTAVPVRSPMLQMLDAGLFVMACVMACIAVFGLLPMLVQYVFIHMVRRWTGRD